MDHDLATGNQMEEEAKGPTPEDEIIQRQRDEFVRTAVRMLSANQRSVVEMRYFRGLAYGEITQQLGLTTTNAWVRLNRAHIGEFSPRYITDAKAMGRLIDNSYPL